MKMGTSITLIYYSLCKVSGTPKIDNPQLRKLSWS